MAEYKVVLVKGAKIGSTAIVEPQALEKELNQWSGKGYDLVSILEHRAKELIMLSSNSQREISHLTAVTLILKKL